MIIAIARALMVLTERSLGRQRRDWAMAMRAEFDLAMEDGKPLVFAAGCLIAAWLELPRQAEGRFAVASYALAIGLFAQLVLFEFACTVGFARILPIAPFTAGVGPDRYVAESQLGAVPMFVLLWILLGVGHVWLAWEVVERNWARVQQLGAALASAGATLVLFAELLFLDVASPLWQAAALMVELGFVIAVARWDAQLEHA